ncbi:TolC family protein [Fontimonas sp. SYSU GA230001]|uniref:TolC family protein n=1 Tax=Fontimonas sp. SYSU GA230001 TaxID=3142450 RepID=UPI0032B32B56
MSRIRSVVFSVSCAALGACAGLPPDHGRGEVARLVGARGVDLPVTADARADTEAALQSPLTVAAAVQLALINNPQLRIELARLGFAAAEVYEAARLANPVLSAARLASADGAPHAQLTLGLAFDFVHLLFLPARRRFAEAGYEAARLDAAAAIYDLATEVESAWYRTAGAEQRAQLRERIAQAATASADLAQRYVDAGNLGRRALAAERAAASQASLAALAARAQAVEERATLNRLMGLDAGQNRWTLAGPLAEPLPQDDGLEVLLPMARDNRLDVAALRRRAQLLADRHGLVRRTRLVGGIELGVERERDFDGALSAGPTLSLELPLFNWGGGRTAAAQAALDLAEAELDARMLDVANAVQLGVARVAAARAQALEHRDTLIPQREAVVAQMQLEHNYMLAGVFDLLLARQQAYDAYAGYIDAVRDYWVARAQLARAVGHSLPSSAQTAQPIDTPPPALPQADEADHGRHPHHGGHH